MLRVLALKGRKLSFSLITGHLRERDVGHLSVAKDGKYDVNTQDEINMYI